jgi:hypothetical protein
VERDHLGDVGIEGRIIIKLTIKKWDGEARTGLLRLETETGGGLLWMER